LTSSPTQLKCTSHEVTCYALFLSPVISS
jgi:hypothetical protein